jgi:hypothetical protein
VENFKRRHVVLALALPSILLSACADKPTTAQVAGGSLSPAGASSSITQAASGKIHGELTPFEATAHPAPVDNTPPGGGKPVTTRNAAIAIAQSDVAEFGNSQVVGARLMPFGDLVGPGHVMSDVTSIPAGFDKAQMVWVVTLQGSYRPQFAKAGDGSFAWGSMMIDSNTGAVLGTFAGQGSVPSDLTGP